MSAIQKGASVAFGHGGSTPATIQIGTSGTEIPVFLQDIRVSNSSSSQEILDGNGECTGKIFFDQRDTLTTTLFISGTDVADAEAKYLTDINPGDILYIGSPWTEANSANASSVLTTQTYTNGQYNYIVDTAEKVRTTSGIAEWSITAVSYATNLTA